MQINNKNINRFINMSFKIFLNFEHLMGNNNKLIYVINTIYVPNFKWDKNK